MLRFNTGIHNFTMEKGKTMGHKNKPNRGSLVKQVQDTLDAKLQIGRKKKPDKITGISQNYIYSWETYHSYLKHCCYFVKWCKENHGCKTIEQCKAYASEWMKTREHLSVYTQKLEASALVKLYGCTLKELNIHTAARQRADIIRSRNTVKRDRHFSESNHAELVAFCRATGLRRAELKALRGTALYQDRSGYYLHITSGSKGGRERYAPIIGDKDLVIRLCKRAGDGKVFEKIPSGHRYTLTETKIPSGYTKNNEQYRVTAAYDKVSVFVSHSDNSETELDAAHPIQIINRAGYELPETGAGGNTIFTAVGCFLILMALLREYNSKKNEKGRMR